MFMVLSSWQSRCESSPGSFDECRTAPCGRQPKTKPDDLGCESARKLSRFSWLVAYRDGLPDHNVLTRSDVAQLR